MKTYVLSTTGSFRNHVAITLMRFYNRKKLHEIGSFLYVMHCQWISWCYIYRKIPYMERDK